MTPATRIRIALPLALLAGVIAVLAVDHGRGHSAQTVTFASGRGCTWYTAPDGSVRAGGRSPGAPTTLRYASTHLVPGDTVCLEGGRYTLRATLWIRTGGVPGHWVTFRPYRKAHPLLVSQFASPEPIVQLLRPAAYVTIRGLRFAGGGTNASAGIQVLHRVHHVRILGNTITRMGSAGIESSSADYLTIARNHVYRFGDGTGWGSGVSLNSGDGAWWYDNRPGFHNVVADNVIAGGVDESHYHSDGNGIILDLGGDISPTLITNNVVYMNGGYGIASHDISGKAYIVNNTLYANGLDPRIPGAAGLAANGSSNQVWANNVTFTWADRAAYASVDSSGILFTHNAMSGGAGVSASVASGPFAQVLEEAPQFVRPPVIRPGDLLWQDAPPPTILRDGLALGPTSPLVDVGVDPLRLPGLDRSLRAGIMQWTMHALNDVLRPQNRGFDYGAYER